MPMPPLSFEGEHFFSIKMLVACKWWVSEDTEIEIQREDGHVKVKRQTHRGKRAM